MDGETLTVLDKAAGEPIGAVGVAATADLDAAVETAKAAQPAWAAGPYDVRAGGDANIEEFTETRWISVQRGQVEYPS